MAKLAVASLGCAKNLVDTEIMLGQLLDQGWELTQDFSLAELILVNTCGFITSAKEESIQQVLELAQYKKSGHGNCRKLAVAGCLVQRYADELTKAIPEVDYWIGLGQIGEVATMIQNDLGEHLFVNGLPFLNDQGLHRHQVTLQHTAYVKIAEGCSHGCAYCAIPLIKGRFRSRKPEAVVKEIRDLVRAGVKEINLIAQDITMYGQDLESDLNLTGLLKRIIAEAGPKWLRLLYAYPSGITSDLLDLIANEPSICKYLDLPLQHIHPRILKLMNRPDSPDQIKEKLALIRDKVPNMVLRTTFIVGFPSESAVEFEELRAFVREGHFQHVGVFPYSREEGTKACQIKGQVGKAIKEKRQILLLKEQQPISQQFLAEMIGKEATVLVDQVLNDGRGIARTGGLAPEIDGVVYLENFHGNAGDFIKCKLTRSDAYNLWAKELS